MTDGHLSCQAKPHLRPPPGNITTDRQRLSLALTAQSSRGTRPKIKHKPTENSTPDKLGPQKTKRRLRSGLFIPSRTSHETGSMVARRETSSEELRDVHRRRTFYPQRKKPHHPLRQTLPTSTPPSPPFCPLKFCDFCRQCLIITPLRPLASWTAGYV